MNQKVRLDPFFTIHHNASTMLTQPSTWYTSRRFQFIALIVLIVFAVGEGFAGIYLKDNDFLWHRNLGEAFLKGDLSQAGGAHYLPARPMLNALTAWMPYRVDRAVVYLAALLALVWTLLAWQKLANRSQPLRGPQAFAAIVFTLGMTAIYLQRDLDDCGLQILLLFFLTAALVQMQAGHSRRCGIWLGLAAVYKVTPLLFLPYLLYKRQWRAAAWMGICMIGLSLAPAYKLGWEGNLHAHERWLESTRLSLGSTDPSENGVEPPNHRNQSLTLAIARYVTTYPPGHVLHLDHPLFAQFGNLDPATGKRVVFIALMCLAALLAWRFRKSLAAAPEDLPREWAAVTILTALMSPLCWVQHLVLVLPACYLLVRASMDGGVFSWQRYAVWLLGTVMTVGGQGDILGRGLFVVLMSYKIHTWAALLAMAMVLMLRTPKSAASVLSLPRKKASVAA